MATCSLKQEAVLFHENLELRAIKNLLTGFASRDFAMSLHFLQSVNIGSRDGDPILCSRLPAGIKIINFGEQCEKHIFLRIC